MVKQYGGVNNSKPMDNIQEAVIVTAPIFRDKKPKSKAGVIGGWLVYWLVTFLITMLVMSATGLFEQLNRVGMPLVIEFSVLPSLLFLFTLVWSIVKSKKIRKQKDAGD